MTKKEKEMQRKSNGQRRGNKQTEKRRKVKGIEQRQQRERKGNKWKEN